MGSSTSSAAGGAARRSRRRRSRTGTSSSRCSSGRSRTRPRRSRRHLLESDHGRVVVISTGQAQAPTHKNAVYAAGKAAAEAWTLALADRFRGTGATANIVVVGAIVTPAMRAESPDKDFSTFTPAEEIAEAIAYLCSDAAATMNGQRLTLRGSA